jgi:hypothetical protein
MANLNMPPIKPSSSVFLQAVIALIAIGALAFLLGEPHLEGRNAHATVFEIYFKDPFLAFAYVASIPFFVALYQAFKLVRFAGQNRMFTQPAVKSLRLIKYCAIAIIGFVLVSVAFMPMADPDDRPPGVVVRVVITFGSIVIATAAAMFERIFQSGLDMKTENDLTV